MAKKIKEKEEIASGWGLFKHLKEETVQGMIAIVFLVVAIFLMLSAFSKGGPVGDTVYKIMKLLLGVGYFLLPILLVMLCVSFLRSLKKDLAIPKIIGSLFFFLSGLGIVNLVFVDQGGYIGHFVSTPLVKLFDFTATLLILCALLIISFLVMFDTSLSFGFIATLWNKITGKKEDGFEEVVPKIAAEERTIETRPMTLPMTTEASTTNKEQKEVSVKKLIKTDPKEKTNGDELFINPVVFRTQKPFVLPPLALLEKDRGKPGVGDIKANANIIKRTLMNFGINVEMDEISIGPSVTRYSLKPAEGVKLSRIVGLQNDLSLALAAHPLRVEAPIPGKSLVGIEIPNTTKTTVGLGTLLANEEYQTSDKPLLVSLGKGISGKSHFANLAKMPHLLIAGATGSGKSATIHAIITSLLYRNSPENLKFIMIDPKRVELTLYNKIPHLLTPVITEAKKAILALKWAAKEMDRRYDVLESESVRDIDSYHKNILGPELAKAKKNVDVNVHIEGEEEHKLPETMPYIVVIIDELADIMQAYPRELEAAIVRLAQMSRAVGIHLMLSTQRPSVNVITGLIKANIPSRIALQVSSQIDSRTILDTGGAEKLLGAGDMLYLSGEMSKPQRIQSGFISENEVKNVVKFLVDSYKDEIPNEIDFTANNTSNSIFEATLDGEGEDEDELYEEAREIVMQAGKASTSFLQRKLRIGYARAARLIDILEEKGVVSAGSGAKPREVLDRDESAIPESGGEAETPEEHHDEPVDIG